MRNLLLLLLLAAFNALLGNKIESAQSGNWTNTSTWKNQKIPSATDTVIINENHEININIDTISIECLITKSKIKFLNAYSLKIKTYISSANCEVSSNFFAGNLLIDSLMILNAKCSIQNVNLQVRGDCIIAAELILSSDNNLKKFENITILKNGKWNNNNNGDPIITGNISNNGTFISCKNTGCTYHFTNDTKLLGDSLLAFTRIDAPSNKKITNFGHFKILLSLEGNPTIDNKNTLELCTSEFAFHAGQLLTNETNNTVIYSDTNDQMIFAPSNGKYENLILKNGRKNISQTLSINRNLELLDSTVLVQHVFQINGNNNAILKIDSTSTLGIGSNDFSASAGFPTNFSQINLHQYSTVLYQSKENQKINSEISYGNLAIDDGAVIESTKTIEHDSLRIRGNLWIAESSVRLKCNNCDIICQGDWNGIGNLEMQNGSFQLKGNGNNYGLLYPGAGEIIYNGTKNQIIKIGDYNKLKINKTSGKAIIKGNSNTFNCKKLHLQKSTLEIGNETVYISDSLINEDKIHFTSTLQSRKINHLINRNGAEIVFKVACTLNMQGNWINKGNITFNNSKIIFSDSLKTQIIEGTNTFNKIDINKSQAILQLNSDIQMLSEITFISGKLNLQSNQITLLYNSKIVNENKKHYIFGNDGKIVVNKLILGGLNDTVNGIGLIIQASTNWGTTKFVRRHSVTFIEGKPSINRLYEIHPSLNNNLNETVIFTYLPHELGSNNNLNLNLYKSEDEVHWFKINSEKDTLKNTFKVSNIHSFSSWTFKNKPEDPLPVQWLSIEIADESSVLWSTASEINTHYFEIQVSKDGINYYTLGKVNACGNCNAPSYYQYALPCGENQYVKVMSVDFNGETSFSKIVCTLIENEMPIILIQGNQLLINNNSEHTTFQLFSMDGKLIIQREMQSNEKINLELPNGNYIYRYGNASKVLMLTN